MKLVIGTFIVVALIMVLGTDQIEHALKTGLLVLAGLGLVKVFGPAFLKRWWYQ